MHESHGTEASQWPDEPSEHFYRLMEAIDENRWPLDMEFEMDVRDEWLQFNTPVTGAPAGMPAPPRLRIKYRLESAHVKEMILKRLPSAKTDILAMSNLTLLARLDRSCFIETAADYFQTRLSAGDRVPASEALGFLIADLHELDCELPIELAERVLSIDQRAGEILTARVIEAMSESPGAEQIGLLEAQALRDGLEAL